MVARTVVSRSVWKQKSFMRIRAVYARKSTFSYLFREAKRRTPRTHWFDSFPDCLEYTNHIYILLLLFHVFIRGKWLEPAARADEWVKTEGKEKHRINNARERVPNVYAFETHVVILTRKIRMIKFCPVL